jgi:hypothetical protein
VDSRRLHYAREDYVADAPPYYLDLDGPTLPAHEVASAASGNLRRCYNVTVESPGSKIMRNFITIAAVALCFGASALASEEDYLGWSEVRFVAKETPDTGRVALTAKVAELKLQSVTIEAFGKSLELSPKQIEKLAGLRADGLSIRATHEAGYEALGGHTVYFKLRQVRGEGERLTETRVVISISNGKGLEVGEPERRVYKLEAE